MPLIVVLESDEPALKKSTFGSFGRMADAIGVLR